MSEFSFILIIKAFGLKSEVKVCYVGLLLLLLLQKVRIIIINLRTVHFERSKFLETNSH